MIINCVTFTGLDDYVSISGLKEISERFPFVEWGALFSPNNTGKHNRYPSYKRVDQFLNNGINFATHLCGGWVTDITRGGFTFPKEYLCGRIQLNMAKDRLQSLDETFWNTVSSQIEKQVIIGGNYGAVRYWNWQRFHDNKIQILFDASGGRGISGKNWQPPVRGIFCGYAGGLGPENVKESLDSIKKVVGDEKVWIDMESKIRKGDRLNLNLCVEFCEKLMDLCLDDESDVTIQ